MKSNGGSGGPQFVEAALNQPITVKEKHQLVRIVPPAGGRENEKARRASAYESCGNKHCPTSMH